MNPVQQLAKFEMDSLEEDRRTWEAAAAIVAVTVAALAGLLIPLGPLLY